MQKIPELQWAAPLKRLNKFVTLAPQLTCKIIFRNRCFYPGTLMSGSSPLQHPCWTLIADTIITARKAQTISSQRKRAFRRRVSKITICFKRRSFWKANVVRSCSSRPCSHVPCRINHFANPGICEVIYSEPNRTSFPICARVKTSKYKKIYFNNWLC